MSIQQQNEFRASIEASNEAAKWVKNNMDFLKKRLFDLFPGAFSESEYRELAGEWLDHVAYCLEVGSLECKLDVPAPTGMHQLALQQLSDELPKNGLSDLSYKYIQESFLRLIG